MVCSHIHEMSITKPFPARVILDVVCTRIRRTVKMLKLTMQFESICGTGAVNS